VFSYFAVWVFYWHRHRIIRRGHNIRLLSNIGFICMTFCFIGGSAMYIIFWNEKIGDKGLCVADHQFARGFSDNDSVLCLEVTIFMDVICTVYLCCIFLIPLCRRLKSLEQSTVLQMNGVDPRRISSEVRYRALAATEAKASVDMSVALLLSTQRMKAALQRTAWAAAVAALSTSLSLILFLWAGTRNWNLDSRMFFVYLDGILTVFSVHISLSPKARWFWSWFVSRMRINRRLATT